MEDGKVFEITQEEFSTFTRRLTQLNQYSVIDKTDNFVEKAREDVDARIASFRKTLSDSNMLTGRQEYEGEVRIASVTRTRLKESLYGLIDRMEANRSELYGDQFKAEFFMFASAFDALEKGEQERIATIGKGENSMPEDKVFEITEEEFFVFTNRLEKYNLPGQQNHFAALAEKDVDRSIEEHVEMLTALDMLTGRQEHVGNVRVASVTEPELKEALHRFIRLMENQYNEPLDVQAEAQSVLLKECFDSFSRPQQEHTNAEEKGGQAMNVDGNIKEQEAKISDREQTFTLSDRQLEHFLKNAVQKHIEGIDTNNSPDLSAANAVDYLKKHPHVNRELMPQEGEQTFNIPESDLKEIVRTTIKDASQSLDLLKTDSEKDTSLEDTEKAVKGSLAFIKENAGKFQQEAREEQSFALTDQQLQKFLTNAAYIRLKHAKNGQEGERFDFSQKENAKFVYASLAYLSKHPDVNVQPEKGEQARTYSEAELKGKLYDTVRYAVAIRKRSLESEKPGLESMAAKQAAQQIIAKQNQPSRVQQLEQRREREQGKAMGR